MIPRGIAKRYATALFKSAINADVAERVYEETTSFRTLMSENKDLRNFLLSPQILTKDKKDVITSTLKDRATDLFVQFLLLLIDKKRFMFVVEIAEGYGYLYERHQGILEVKAITAVTLEDHLKQKTIDKLSEMTGKKIRLSTTVDPDIIGGMILVMEDKIIDGSIKFSLKKLSRELDEIRV